MKTKYWIAVASRAWRESADLSRFDNAGRFVVALISAFATVAGGWLLSSTFKEIALKVVAYLAVMVIVALAIFAWKMFSIPSKLDAERHAEIESLEAENQRLKDRTSDIGLSLADTHFVMHHPDYSYNGYTVIIENVGRRPLSNCILKYAVDKPSWDLVRARHSYRPLSDPFTLKKGEVIELPILLFPNFFTKENDRVAIPYVVVDGTGPLDRGSGYEILTPDDKYIMRVEALSDDTDPAHLTIEITVVKGVWKIGGIEPDRV